MNRATIFAMHALVIIGFSRQVLAKEFLSGLAHLSRCYSHLTQRKLPLRHPLRSSVVAGTLSPVDACMNIIEKASLVPGGSDEGMQMNPDVESRAVLRTLNDHHRNWFPNDDIVISSPQCGERCPYADFVHDGAEAALHLTRVLLTKDAKFSEIVTGSSALEALRSGGPRENASQAANRIFMGNSVTSGYDPAPIPLDMELTQFGHLNGIRQIKLNSRKYSAVAKSNTGGSRPSEFFIHRSYGGGILGTKSYLLLNFGRPDAASMNGGLTMPRRWASAILKDLMCRELPLIRISDAVPFVQHTVTADTPAFRTSASCMQCHSTIDPMSAVARNVAYTFTPGYFESNVLQKQISSQMYEFAVDHEAEVGSVDKDPFFHRRPPLGSLYFRNYRGELVHRSIRGIAGLGETLAEMEDLYLCAAARYFRFFTGIHVPLADPGETGAGESRDLNPYREQVVKLGLALKAHQSLPILIRSILESDVYRTSSYSESP